jgi:predicted CopG family antitoxin
MRTTISVEKETHEKLSQRGKKGDSFDKIINEILEGLN